MNINSYKFIIVYFCTILATFTLFLITAFLNQFFITSLVYDVDSINCKLFLDTAELVLINRYLMADGLLTMPYEFISKYWGWIVPIGNILVFLMVWTKQIKHPRFNNLAPIVIISSVFLLLSMGLGNLGGNIVDYHNTNNKLAREVTLLRNGIDLNNNVSLHNNRDYRYCYNSKNITIKKEGL